jgi:hypothetical protein
MQGYVKDTADALRQASLLVGDALDGLEESVLSASNSAASALESKNAAAVSQTGSADSASSAFDSKNAAAISEGSTAAAALAALESKNAAALSATNAGASAGSAATSATAAAASAAASLGVGLGYIEGLRVIYNNANSISVTSGMARIESGALIKGAATLTLSGLTLTANTWYHLYLYSNAGVAAVELVTTAPAEPFNAEARSKTGDTSRRFLGSFRSAVTANTLCPFGMDGGNWVTHLGDTNGLPCRILNGGTNTAWTPASCSPAVPPTSRAVRVECYTSSPAYAQVGLTSAVVYQTINSGVWKQVDAYLTASQQLFYIVNSSGAVFIDVLGYRIER